MNGPNQLRILVADDHVIARTLKELLSTRGDWKVCAEAATGREAVSLAEQHRPDIIVMDIVMPELSGLEATRRIRRLLPKTEVVVLSLHYSDELVREIVDAGARAASDPPMRLGRGHRPELYNPCIGERYAGRAQRGIPSVSQMAGTAREKPEGDYGPCSGA